MNARLLLAAIPSLMLLAALASWPYGYYTFLRLVVTGCAIALIVVEYQRTNKFSALSILLIGIALLFNPLVPVHLTRDLWALIDVGCAVLFAVVGVRNFIVDRSADMP
jgi:hypothetical protein